MKDYLQKVIEARDAAKAADEAFVETIKMAFPVGCKVGVKSGRAMIFGEVVGHATAGYNSGYVRLINEATGKERSIYAASDYDPMQRVD